MHVIVYMVYIKKVEIFGFKSFGFKNTIVDFRPGLITVSGPNGSGKSNILDAIIFAMGENRPRIMRVDKLRSLIHDIENKHRGTKMVRSSIHFDNTDRKIPINSDTVEITREMDTKGENTYYINKKKSQRNSVINLLDAANAGLSQLNSLQQGTVTRISEFTPEEKRKSIEDLIGLSYFDDKKEEAEKQLVDADHRLEIALTRMDEVKKNIDDLEEARNIFLRHKVLEKEIIHLNVIDAVRNLKIVNSEILLKKINAEELAKQMQSKRAMRDEMRIKIEKIDSDKSDFLKEADAYSRAKANVDSSLGELIRKSKESEAFIIVTTRRIKHIISRIPQIDHELRITSNEQDTNSKESTTLHKSLDSITTHRNAISEKLKESNVILADMLNHHVALATQIAVINKQGKKISNDKILATVEVSKFEAELSDSNARFSSNHSKRVAMDANITSLSNIYSRLEGLIDRHKKSVITLQSHMSTLGAKKVRIQKDIDELGEILEKSQNATVQYNAKLKMIRSLMHEDYSIAKLKKNAKDIGIEGFVYEMLTWDPKYERAALAAGSEWIKSIVTKDIATMLGLSEYARSKHLAKLKIISLERISNPNIINKTSGLNVLSDHIKCKQEYKPLVMFLFGNVIIAKSFKEACKLAIDGHRAVTLEGELVESGSSAIVIDMNSKISKLTKIIDSSATLDGLRQSIILLKEYLDKKRTSRQRTDAALHHTHDKLASSESSVTTSQSEYESLAINLGNAQKTLQHLDEQNAKITHRNEYVKGEILRLTSTINALDAQITVSDESINDSDNAEILGKLESLQALKIALEVENEQVVSEYNNASSMLLKIDSALEQCTERTNRLTGEQQRLIKEKTELGEKINEQNYKQDANSKEIAAIRQQEQELISTQGTSISHINEYDSQLDKLRARDRNIERELGTIIRTDDSLRRDLTELTSRGASLKRICDTHNVSNGIGDIDVKRLLNALRVELESITNINTGAAVKYLEISTGYRSMSTKKNALESERNKIVAFIDGVEKSKRQKFLEAFSITSTEITNVFTKMTGGTARLELEDEDDVFNSGISYLVQFPNKPKRESAAISGGEKSLAAIVFVLGLQKLNPSPFYLFDEVDAHLDAPNSERLANILVDRSKNSQFIVVSLKDSIIKKAKLVYGVYPKGGVSHVLSYRDKQIPSTISN